MRAILHLSPGENLEDPPAVPIQREETESNEIKVLWERHLDNLYKSDKFSEF